ncbi:glycoside hydrolase superfamily [Daedaleopsis nitida]|nr:glycoside hydrolase superfamily [Daedaleopsis nitida]
MISTTGNFSALLQALSLAQGSFKPSPAIVQGPSAPIPAISKIVAPSVNDSGNHLPAYGATYGAPPTDYSSFHPVALNQQGPDCSVQPYQTPDLGMPAFAPYDPAKAVVFRYRQQQSVNLGSWFVHEQWMTPSLFTCASGTRASEADIAYGWGSHDNARAVLERHWDTFITAADFQYLASIGINTVRLPIGYWNLGPDFCQGTVFESVASVYQNSWGRVVHAINTAADYGIGVLVDLHGAPGSQNGQQHSGISDGGVGLFGNDYYEGKTMAVLTYLMQELVNVTNVVGIQVLNEPQNVDELPDFYARAITAMRQVGGNAASFPLYFHDGFDLKRFSDFVANRKDFVVQDHHSYFVFTASDASESATDHVGDVHGSIAHDLASASERQRRNLVVDEFSCALTDQSLSRESDPDGARWAFCEGQVDIYQNETAGWSFWSYDKEDCYDDPGWCFKAAVGKSLPNTFFSYGKGPLGDPSRIPALADMIAEMGSPSYNMSDIPSPGTTTSPSPSEPSVDVGIFQGIQRRSRFRSDHRSRPLHTRRSHGRKREDASQLPAEPDQRAIAKGYSDGFLTAKIFALYGMSKLGFTGQYISDSLAKLGGNVIEPGMEQYYEQWFMEGLSDGEALISSNVN